MGKQKHLGHFESENIIDLEQLKFIDALTASKMIQASVEKTKASGRSL